MEVWNVEVWNVDVRRWMSAKMWKVYGSVQGLSEGREAMLD